jgi:cobalt-zinc-cadmium resistance protein CzcA
MVKKSDGVDPMQPPYGPTMKYSGTSYRKNKSSIDLLTEQTWDRRQLRSIPGVADLVAFGGADCTYVDYRRPDQAGSVQYHTTGYIKNKFQKVISMWVGRD